jgi:hypothetical protein
LPNAPTAQQTRVECLPDVDHAAGVGDVVGCGDRRVAVAQDVAAGVQPPAVSDQGVYRAT